MKIKDRNLLYQIFYFLNNEDILKIIYISKSFYRICDDKFKYNIYNRKHPIVFNLLDNYCCLCNVKRLYYNFDNTIKCSHIYFKKR